MRPAQCSCHDTPSLTARPLRPAPQPASAALGRRSGRRCSAWYRHRRVLTAWCDPGVSLGRSGSVGAAEETAAVCPKTKQRIRAIPAVVLLKAKPRAVGRIAWDVLSHESPQGSLGDGSASNESLRFAVENEERMRSGAAPNTYRTPQRPALRFLGPDTAADNQTNTQSHKRTNTHTNAHKRTNTQTPRGAEWAHPSLPEDGARAHSHWPERACPLSTL
jgi:hypothetical protein